MMFTSRSVLVVLAVTTTATTTITALSSTAGTHRTIAGRIPSPSSTALDLGPLDDRGSMSDYGKQKQKSELDGLTSVRDQIRARRLANTKPDDDTPPAGEMDDAEVRAMFAGGDAAGAGGPLDADDLFAADYVPDFKTKRSGSGQARGLSGGESGGVLDDPNAEDEEGGIPLFVDWTEDYDDENEFHVPNRMGFSTVDWGVGRAGFVGGKLKKKERRSGKFNKADLRKAYQALQQNGISLVETSESNSFAEAFINKFNQDCDYGNNQQGPLVASTFPNPWKHALKSKSLPRKGAKAVIAAAEESCERMGISSMSLYQVQNPGYYIGGSTALAEGMLDVVADDHSRYAGCVNMSLAKLAKLQKKLRAQGEFVATNQFEFSLTSRKSLAMIEACKKLGITPVCTNVLDGGLATGKYTSTNPTGGEVSKDENDTGPYAVRKLEKLEMLFKVQNSLREKVDRRIGDRLMKYQDGQAPKINRDITTTQIAINYVRAKGAVPLVPVNNVKMANEMLGCLGWDLSEEEVEELDKACKACGL